MDGQGGGHKGRQSTATTLGMGARIRSVRFRLDRSEEQFASLVGVRPEAVEAWEAGHGVKREDLVRIADKTGASLHWLISGLSPLQIEAIRIEAMESLVRRRSQSFAFQNPEAQSFAERQSVESELESSDPWLFRQQGEG